MAREGGPWIVVAVAADTHKEEDGFVTIGRISGGGIVDRPRMITVPVVLYVTGGEPGRQYRLGAQVFRPDGRTDRMDDTTEPFPGENETLRLNITMQVMVSQEGTYWFRYLLDNVVKAEIPYVIAFNKTSGTFDA